MAKFKTELPNELIKAFDGLEKDTEKMLGEMTRAGAEVVLQKMKASAPNSISAHILLTKTYKTPSDGGINTKVAVYGYLPFMPPRTTFSRGNGGRSGKVYTTSKGIPAEFLAILYEYGRSTSPFPKRPFMRKAFRGGDIEKAMYKVQEKYFNKYAWTSRG